ncbi:MAG: signal peptidase I [Actinomycetota bacterium]
MGARASAAEPSPGGAQRQKQSAGQFFRELPVLVIFALGIAILVKTYVVQAFFIPSGSMEDTLLINDRVIVSKFVYRFTEPEHPNVIVFASPLGQPQSAPDSGPITRLLGKVAEGLGMKSSEQDFIKRVVATQGQTVEIKEGAVHIDGQRLDERYLKESTPLPDYGPTTVPNGQIFVMGDNRNSSEDSRVFGPIPVSSVVGRAVTLIWPVNRIRWIGNGS